MTNEEIITAYEAVLRIYANPDSWVRGVVWYKTGKINTYGFEIAQKVLKDIEEKQNEAV
jgi:hypothetical protein